MENNVHVCKDCISHLQEISGQNLNAGDVAGEQKTLKDILSFCLPHLTSQDINKLSICTHCMTRLRNLHEFISNSDIVDVVTSKKALMLPHKKQTVGSLKKLHHRKRKCVSQKRLKLPVFKRSEKRRNKSCLSLGELWRGRELLLKKTSRRLCKKCLNHN